jgi:uncharacterized membrane protein (DUF2068 family)
MKATDAGLVRLIAGFKLLKAAILIVVGVGVLRLVHSDLTSLVTDWVAKLGLDPERRYVGRMLLEAASFTPTRLKELGAGSLIYAGLFLTEGIGLWLVKRWAEWLTIILTSSLVPLEIYAIYQDPTETKILFLLVNIAVVGFLVYRVRSERPR